MTTKRQYNAVRRYGHDPAALARFLRINLIAAAELIMRAVGPPIEITGKWSDTKNGKPFWETLPAKKVDKARRLYNTCAPMTEISKLLGVADLALVSLALKRLGIMTPESKTLRNNQLSRASNRKYRASLREKPEVGGALGTWIRFPLDFEPDDLERTPNGGRLVFIGESCLGSS